MAKKITAHTLVKNEMRFLWFAVMSVLPYIDEMLLWDTGSTDGTRDIIKRIRELDISKKIDFRECGEVDKASFAQARQEMLDATKTDWFIVVDGDEIWWQDSIRKVVQVVESSTSSSDIESIVVPTVNLVGDIYHYQEEKAGGYNLAGRKGHYNLRGVNRKIPGLHSLGEHGVWGWVDGENKMIQDRKSKVKFINAPYMHATFLERARDVQASEQVPKRAKKQKYEIGIPFPADYFYPEVFFQPKPDIIPSPWRKMSKSFYTRAFFETPLRKIKRRIYPRKVGY